ncbi:hypothetical protein [Corynebacterium sp. H113]|uniref:hypothetical protein n=1 Tax=Corynebacterium sp. H113 TaxID=3133419 RepID=UPI0030A0141F
MNWQQPGTGWPQPHPGLMSPEQLNAPVRFRARAVSNWAVAGFVMLAFGLVALSLGYTDHTSDIFKANIFRVVSTLFFAIAGVCAAVVGVFVWITLAALKRRAQYWQPPLNRDFVSISTMHVWPVRNITGPVVALAETGVTGSARYVWFATCALWPLGLIWAIVGDSALTNFQSGVVLCLAFATTAITARTLALALEPESGRRQVMLGRQAPQPGFWSRGIIEPATSAKAELTMVTPPLDDSIEKLFIKEND